MTIVVSVKTDFDRVIRELGAQQKQVAYAAALALTKTAQDGQTEVRGEMPRNFTVRRPWVVQGIRIRAANKRNLTATIYSRDPFMKLQELGGTKRSIRRRVFEWGEYLAVPLDARKSKAQIVRKEDWPENLVRPFVVEARDGRRYLAVRSVGTRKGQRAVGRLRKAERTSTGVKLMYTLIRQAELKPRLGLRRIALRVVQARWPINLRASLLQALRSAKP